MFLTSVFIISGLALVLLLWVKHLEEKRENGIFILNLISRGDIQAHELTQKTAHLYSEFREWLEFFIKKQLPLHSKNMFNKSHSLVKEKSDKYFELIRNSKLLKKSDGISEFFKNVSSVEKRSGEIVEYTLDDPESREKNKE